MARKPKTTANTNGHSAGPVRATTELIGTAAEHFRDFKRNFGIRNDAEALRQLATQRLIQLKRTGKLAKAA